MEMDKLQRKLVRGFISLTFRKIILDAINFVTIFVILAKVLPIQIIGIYSIAQSILSFFTYFSDVGLAAALIQKKEVTKDDLKTTFTIQEILVLILTLLIWVSAPTLAGLYNLDNSGMWLIRALGIGFFLSSLKVVPSTVLERELKFEPLVLAEVVETLVFNSLLIYLTFQNYGLWSYTYAVIARGIVGAVVVNAIAPWKISFGFSKASAKTLINFGIPFQLNSLLALLKDRLTPLITARIIGDVGVGYLSWAQGIAYRPLEVMNIVIRITFPAFSRLQDKPDELRKIVEKSLFLTVLFLYPFLFGLLAILPFFIVFMGKEKFLPALPLIYLFAFSTFWAAPSTTFTNVLNAVGRVGITLKLMVMWTILTWILSPILALTYGYLGVALASAIISFSSIVPIVIVVRMLKVDIVKSLAQPLIASVIMGGIVYGASLFLPTNLLTLSSLVVLGGFIYVGYMFVFARNEVLENLKDFRNVKA